MSTSEITAGEDRKPDLPDGFKWRLFRQLVTELGPLIVFFLVFMWKDIIWATGVYLAATLISVSVSVIQHTKVPVLPLVSALLVMIFGGLTILMDEEVFIKIKPTVTNGFYGIALGLSWIMGYRLIQKVLGPECKLDEDGLRTLTIRVSLYLICLALVNELVWRTVSTDTWVVFKVFVIIGLNLLFAWSQVAVVRKHLRASHD